MLNNTKKYKILSVNRAKDLLKNGKILLYPTEAVYGIGCNAFDEKAVYQLLTIKKRPVEKGLILLVHSWAQIEPLIIPITNEARQRVLQTWPGPVTWLFPKSTIAPKWITGDSAFIAIRMSGHPIARDLCINFPIVSTSANVTNQPAIKDRVLLNDFYFPDVAGIVEGELGGQENPTQIIEVESGKIHRL